MIYVIATIRVKEGHLQRYLDVLKANVPIVLQEEGCIEYAPAVDEPAGLPNQELNPNVITLVEKWRSIDDLKAHLSAPHFLEYREKVKDILEGVTVRVLREA